MAIVPFVHEGLGNSSYLVEAGRGLAVLVDPDRSTDRYLDEARSRSLRITAVLETHLHADFVSGVREVTEATGATAFVPAGAQARFAHRPVHAGEHLRLGDLTIDAIASPGHTPEHLSYSARADGEPPVLFSGGALIVGGAARTDLIEPEMTEALTRAEFATLHQAFQDLPDDTILAPTHGGGSFCSVAGSGERTSTLGRERRTNPLLAPGDEDEFVRSFPATFPAVPAYFWRMRAINAAGPRLRRDIARPGPLDPQAFDRARREALVVDARPAEDFAAGHIPGSLSDPLRPAFAVWLGWLAPPEASLAFVTDGVAVDLAVDEALLVGFERFAGFLAGGMEAWTGAGLPVRRFEYLGPNEARARLDEGARPLDVREPNEFAAGHLPGATNIPLGDLRLRTGELPAGIPMVVYCGHGERSSSALSILEAAGFDRLANLDGGYGAWKEAVERVS